MKRNDLTTGQTYAWRSQSWNSAERATVLTTEPHVNSRPQFRLLGTTAPEVALPDGSIVNAWARPAEPHDTPAQKGVLIRTASGWVGVVRPTTLLGPWDEYVAQRDADFRAEQEQEQVEGQRKAAAEARRHATAELASDLLGVRATITPSPDARGWVVDPAQMEALLALAQTGRGA